MKERILNLNENSSLKEILVIEKEINEMEDSKDKFILLGMLKIKKQELAEIRRNKKEETLPLLESKKEDIVEVPKQEIIEQEDKVIGQENKVAEKFEPRKIRNLKVKVLAGSLALALAVTGIVLVKTNHKENTMPEDTIKTSSEDTNSTSTAPENGGMDFHEIDEIYEDYQNYVDEKKQENNNEVINSNIDNNQDNEKVTYGVFEPCINTDDCSVSYEEESNKQIQKVYANNAEGDYDTVDIIIGSNMGQDVTNCYELVITYQLDENDKPTNALNAHRKTYYNNVENEEYYYSRVNDLVGSYEILDSDKQDYSKMFVEYFDTEKLKSDPTGIEYQNYRNALICYDYYTEYYYNSYINNKTLTK